MNKKIGITPHGADAAIVKGLANVKLQVTPRSSCLSLKRRRRKPKEEKHIYGMHYIQPLEGLRRDWGAPPACNSASPDSPTTPIPETASRLRGCAER